MTLLDHILDAFLPSARAFLAGLRRQLLAVRRPVGLDFSGAMSQGFRRVLTVNTAALAQHVRRPLLASWLAPAYHLGREAYAGGNDLPPTSRMLAAASSPQPSHEYLFHQRGLEWLHDRRVVPSAMLPELDASARRNAEVIAHATTEETARRLTEALGQSIRDGGTLKEMRQAVGEAFDSSPLSDSQVETLYRTNGGRAYAAGQQYTLSHPLVRSEFPYVLYTAVHDSRTGDKIPGLPCPSHRMMEQLGQNGTAVYRADDPVIRKFWPPWRWRCRCHAIPLNLADAARHGSEEARQWLETGRPPSSPLYVPHPPFDLPTGWQPVSGWRFPGPVV